MDIDKEDDQEAVEDRGSWISTRKMTRRIKDMDIDEEDDQESKEIIGLVTTSIVVGFLIRFCYHICTRTN